jgi:hypothetical protein
MKRYSKLILILTILFFLRGNSQPYTDIANYNYQTFSSNNSSNSSTNQQTDVYALSLFVPRELKNGNTLLFRVNSESIHSSFSPSPTQTHNVSSVSLGFGYQWLSKSQKWKSVLLGIPKVASDFEDAIGKDDFQFGLLFIENYKVSTRLQIKAGIYFNEEVFGHFIVPLLGVDWQASENLRFYGILPTNYKIEYAISKKKLYTGLNFKALTRTFQLSESQNSDYIRFDEVVLKGIIEYYCLKNVVAFAEIGRSFGKAPLQYLHNSKELSNPNVNSTSTNNYTMVSFGLAYRIRTD